MSIDGVWYNELGSIMTLTVKGNFITGKYQTAVGDTKGIYDLVGQIDTDKDPNEALGWVVVWNNRFGSKDSVTSWSGQRQQINGVDTIITTWLLTTETDASNDWRSTIVGKDNFTRQEPAAELVKIKNASGLRASFPV